MLRDGDCDYDDDCDSDDDQCPFKVQQMMMMMTNDDDDDSNDDNDDNLLVSQALRCYTCNTTHVDRFSKEVTYSNTCASRSS